MDEQTEVAQHYSRSTFTWSLYGVIKMLSSLYSYKCLIFSFLLGAADSCWADAVKRTNCIHFCVSECNNSEPIAVLCC